jgi:antitoxin component of RelBE/YafQ-DinJ toxin-antitoxin module
MATKKKYKYMLVLDDDTKERLAWISMQYGLKRSDMVRVLIREAWQKRKAEIKKGDKISA